MNSRLDAFRTRIGLTGPVTLPPLAVAVLAYLK